MKIEKVNDNQIRCTLTREDLDDRQIKLSELAYGSEKARSLFKDMIEQANYEFGFEANDIPLMIEAIPLSSESIILVITKVEYPDELDTRFSKFTQPDDESIEEESEIEFSRQGADDIIGLFEKLKNTKNSSNPEEVQEEKAVDEIRDLTRMFEFENLNQVCMVSNVLDGAYDGPNALYKDNKNAHFYLTLHKGEHSPAEFNKVCNMIAEYGKQKKYKESIDAFFKEHNQIILDECAIQTLAQL